MANEHNNKRPTAASHAQHCGILYSAVCCGRTVLAMEKPTYSEQEKRDLAKCPS